MWAKMMKHKKWLIAALVVIIGGGGAYAWQQGNKAQVTTAVQTASVGRGDVATVISSTGTIQPVNSVDISSKITGQLKEVRVRENEQVKAGQVLVVIKDTELQADATQARERLDNAAVNYERNKRLSKIGAVSDQQMDNLALEYRTAQANYDSVMSKLSDTVITSPIDGTVIGKPMSAGEMVAQGISNPMVILTVADMSKMQIETLVDETDIGKVVVGQKASFTVDAYPNQTFTGVVSEISQKATTQQNVVYYTVTIEVQDGQNKLKPSMTARVSINANEAKNVLTLPLSAIKTDKNGQYVTVVRENGKQENIKIVTGITGDGRVEVVSGLVEGDKVVTSQTAQQTKQTGTGQRSGGMMPRM